MPGHNRGVYVPFSEHLHEKLKPILEETLFLGAEYERGFDTEKSCTRLSTRISQIVAGDHSDDLPGRPDAVNHPGVVGELE
jgi:hypothetical protein